MTKNIHVRFLSGEALRALFPEVLLICIHMNLPEFISFTCEKFQDRQDFGAGGGSESPLKNSNQLHSTFYILFHFVSLNTARQAFFGEGAAGSTTPAATTGRADWCVMLQVPCFMFHASCCLLKSQSGFALVAKTCVRSAEEKFRKRKEEEETETTKPASATRASILHVRLAGRRGPKNETNIRWLCVPSGQVMRAPEQPVRSAG